MASKTAILSLVFLLAGMFVLGNVFTGYSVSGTCCFPSGCDKENLCNTVDPPMEYSGESNHNYTDVYMGSVMIIFSLLLYMVARKRIKREI